MQLMPKQTIGSVGGHYLKDSKTVIFHPQPSESLENLSKVMSSGFVSFVYTNVHYYQQIYQCFLKQAGCVHFPTTPNCEIKVLILLYTAEKKAFLGFVPNNQVGFIDKLKKTISSQKQQRIVPPVSLPLFFVVDP